MKKFVNIDKNLLLVKCVNNILRTSGEVIKFEGLAISKILQRHKKN